MVNKTNKQTDKIKDTDEIAKAVQLLAEEQQRRIQECMNEIQAVLEKYGLELVVSKPVISLKPRE